MKNLISVLCLFGFVAAAQAKPKTKPPAASPASTAAKAIPGDTGIRALNCKFDLSTHDNKTVFNTLLFPVKADEALEGKGLQGLLGPFKVQIIFHSSKYGEGKKAQPLLDKLTLTMWEPSDDTNPVAITGSGEGDAPLDLATVSRTRHMVKLTNEKKIVYYCSAPK